MKHLFFGGIHPNYNKEMSTDMSVCRDVSPKIVTIPMQQHIGTPCTPLVQVGDRVLMGQKIGDGDGLCVPVHASVSGTVIAVEERPHPTAGKAMAVVIENDFKEEIQKNPIPATEEEMLAAIREAGIVGMGGAAFPGNVKALSAMGNVDTLIANACECEPYITADDMLLRTDPRKVLDGMMILEGILHPKQVVLAVEDNKTEAIAILKNLLGEFPKITLKILPTRYPQGAEKQLVQAVTGREVPPGKLPVSVGCAVFNVSTFSAIRRAVREGRNLTKRIVTVTGEGVAKPRNYLVPIGTSFHDLLEAAGGISEKTERLISGGPMMGVSQMNADVPVVKATNSVLCLLKDENGAAENPTCLRCGKCVNVCPMRLMPLYLFRYCMGQNKEELERLHLMDCMECGSCAFTCPGKLPLVEKFRLGKKLLKEEKR